MARFTSGTIWLTAPKEEITRTGIRLLTNHRAEGIDTERKTVLLTTPDKHTLSQGYDRLIIATGAESIRPDILGLELPGVHFLRRMSDSFAVHACLTEKNPQSAAAISAWKWPMPWLTGEWR